MADTERELWGRRKRGRRESQNTKDMDNLVVNTTGTEPNASLASATGS